MTETRTEHDSMGEVEVPRDALWRAQTQRAIENFPISGLTIAPSLVVALARVKRAAAAANSGLGVITAAQADAIVTGADALIAGEHHDAFPIDVFQTGSGTSSNMNVNEVLASLAKRAGVELHPNDVVNASQSSNDTFPTAIHVAAAESVTGSLVPSLEHLAAALERKADEFSDLVKSGRTHLMDAVPVTLGQEFSGYVAQLEQCDRHLHAALPRAPDQ